MELSLEEALDVLLEIISGGVIVSMMYFYMHSDALSTILARLL